MGVQGLWHLLQPCGRPTKLESLEGRRLAIDSSIWLYHFQMAMRDKEGRTLSNAHILGFLWRILKLIHFGIRPIFVFDGGAPVLKRKTLSGRKTRKTGARDDHRRVAERLLHARMREAALSHVAKGTTSSADAQAAQAQDDEHGLGDNVVYMDDLVGPSGANHAEKSGERDAVDDGSISNHKAKEREREAEAAKKKKRDQWQKDPYALPDLQQDISSITADNSRAAKKGRGGGRKPDIRFATEGELRSLLSSIQPTDLDLDSDFFRSLPTELQYELVGDLRAASRGTSYKRLQSMLASSPTPIDFSRAQIAGLKTRNELTQKVLEVTDEIGDAHIKVPIRVAGARNREYVLIRNKGNQAGFVLGVRETGTTQDKAIQLDEDSASATTADDDLEKRHTDEEVDLEEVAIQPSPQKPRASEASDEFRNANPNDPSARRQVARELLQRRARELAKEKAREQGIVDEKEALEEELERMRKQEQVRFARAGKSSQSATLFLEDEIDLDKIGREDSYDESDVELESVGEDATYEDELQRDEEQDLINALQQSEREARIAEANGSESGEEDLELDDVETLLGFEAGDYSLFYDAPVQNGSLAEQTSKESTAAASPLSSSAHDSTLKDTTLEKVDSSMTPGSAIIQTLREQTPERAIKGRSGLGFRMLDREGYPERLDPKLLKKVRTEKDEQDNDERGARMQSSKPQPTMAESVPKAPSAISIASTDTSDNVQDDMSEEYPSPGKTKVDTSVEELPSRTERVEKDVAGNEIKIVDFNDSAEPAKAQSISSLADESDVRRSNRESPIEDDSQKPSSQSESVEDLDDRESADNFNQAQSVSSVDQDEELSPRNPDVRESTSPRQGTPKQATTSPNLSDEPGSPEIARREMMRSSGIGLRTGSPEPDEKATAAEIPSLFTKENNEEDEGDADRVMEHDDRADSPMVGEEPLYSPDWSRSPTPQAEEDHVVLGPDGFPLPTAAELEAMEAEDEADLGHLEGDQDEFVSFLSRAKGRGLNEVRQEVEDEVNRLRSEHAATRRSEGDVTQQMAKEIQLMLRLFGLPYITAPMEAEAQCAELVAIGLADGVITDDSDVFLFGGTFVYKNMFNNKKYVECYKLSDLQHDLGMDRTKLVQLAYLLGSDYTDGLEGVGPVLAMEILSNFSGDDALIKFREWWLKVQKGQDAPRDTCNATLKRIKRTLRNKVHLTDNWPDAHVLNAYYEPTVDSSEEPFQWGLPDLDSLRSFFSEYLTWDREKTDHYLVPAIEEQNRRSRRTQGTLDNSNFFDLTAGQGAFAARQRPGFQSSRLQQVITNFRQSNKKATEKRKELDGQGQEAVDISDDEEENGEKQVSEQLLGKEMGKRSRPIVSGNGARQSEQHGTEPMPEQVDGTDDKTNSNRRGKKGKEAQVKSKTKEVSTTKKRKNGSRKVPAKRQKGKEKDDGIASDGSDVSSEASRNEHDEEWLPRKAKAKKRKTGPADDAPGMRLAQARGFNLDNIDTLPPSRARSMLQQEASTSADSSRRPSLSAYNSRESVDRAQQTIFISEDEESSDLSD